uniref:Tetratricopeptide repeat protein n=1 Tax=Noctiluca scintillans TaxID=2966 RepID=A0A7S1FJ42_NOCSC
MAEAHYNLAGVLLELDSVPDAVEHLRKALEVDPCMAKAYDALGGILLELEELDGAAAAFQSALSLDPKLFDTHVHLGHALVRSENLTSAAAAYNSALSIEQQADVYVHLGELRRSQGENAAATELFRQALQLEPDSEDIGARYRELLNESCSHILVGR